MENRSFHIISGDISRCSSMLVTSGVSDLRVEIWGCIATKRSGNTSSGTASNTFVCVLSVSFMHAWVLSLLGVLTLNKKTQWKIVSIDLNTCTLSYDTYSLLNDYKTRGIWSRHLSVFSPSISVCRRSSSPRMRQAWFQLLRYLLYSDISVS